MKYKNYRNPYTNDNRIYTKRDLYDMPFGEFIKRKQEVLSQFKVLGVPTEKELQGSSNVVRVEAYTREDGTKVKAHYRSKPNGGSVSNTPAENKSENGINTEPEQKANKREQNTQDSVTGAAAEVKEDVKNTENKKDVPPMTKSAENQEILIKNLPIWEVKSNPEQEYYRIAFELQKVKETGEVPDWIKEHNDIRTLDKIGNKELSEKIKEKIIEGAKDNNDSETLNNLDNVYVVTAKPNSKLTKVVENNEYFQNEIGKRMNDIESGKYQNNFFSLDFPNSENKIFADSNKDFSTHNTLGRCDIHDLKIDSDGYISATVIDYYDFDKNNTAKYVKNGYIQQQNGHLTNYALMIPIRVKIKK